MKLLDGGLEKKKKLKRIRENNLSLNVNSSVEGLQNKLTKDPFSWNVAFWDVTLNGGSGGLMQTE